MNQHYLKCSFKEGGAPYTYHYEGTDPLSPGDKVTVETKHGTASETVVMALDEAPAFPTKAIVGKKSDPEQERLDLIDKWHDTDQSQPLHEFLGMTWDEYAAWVEAGNKSGFDRAGDGQELPA